jgi:hypothetical protein
MEARLGRRGSMVRSWRGGRDASWSGHRGTPGLSGAHHSGGWVGGWSVKAGDGVVLREESRISAGARWSTTANGFAQGWQ